MTSYEQILKTNADKVEGAEALDDDEITDIVTNYLACSTNQEESSQ
jgi:hypothetical protein